MSAEDTQPLRPQVDNYTDDFVSIDSKTLTLTIKHYLLINPTHHVRIMDILYIRPAKDLVQRFGVRPYGFSLKGIIWARDWSRGGSLSGPRSGLERSFIMKVKGDIVRTGFSVEDPQSFLKVLDLLRPGIVEIPMGEDEEAEIGSEIEASKGAVEEDLSNYDGVGNRLE